MRLQTGVRHQKYPASLRGLTGCPLDLQTEQHCSSCVSYGQRPSKLSGSEAAEHRVNKPYKLKTTSSKEGGDTMEFRACLHDNVPDLTHHQGLHLLSADWPPCALKIKIKTVTISRQKWCRPIWDVCTMIETGCLSATLSTDYAAVRDWRTFCHLVN